MKQDKEYTDLELVEIFKKSGDMEVLGMLYERYMHLVYGVCLKYFENREDARDGVTGIFEKLIDEVTRHELDNFKGWLYVVTKNFCLMKLRADRSKQEKAEKWQNEQYIFMESAQEMHPIDEEGADLNKRLEECIKLLKAAQKQCIHQFYYENRSYREISELLKMDEKKVKSYIQNGKRNLKLCIETRKERLRSID